MTGADSSRALCRRAADAAPFSCSHLMEGGAWAVDGGGATERMRKMTSFQKLKDVQFSSVQCTDWMNEKWRIGWRMDMFEVYRDMKTNICFCVWLTMQQLFRQKTWKESDLLFEGWEVKKNCGRVSSLKVSTLLCLQLPLEFTLTTFQLTWCAPASAVLLMLYFTWLRQLEVYVCACACERVLGGQWCI